ncbi:chemotaxis signal transduction protein [Clostridium putrefaciens]|uniref:Chemotaxis signal transduction protein n=1 Tax=Clostridium putrefaciens TaxID=99675 RepID=A0A381JAP9_9CLOT|nr:chemotaxis protein CheW [Clostridium putrefaciens]SUY47516.1 chemotaxis signal transduction protein [Clostridium putrefaciens]
MDERHIKVLVFSLNGESYATDIMEVERILGYEKPTVLPDAPDFIDGVINYEDHILPVISIVKKFKIQEAVKDADTKIIVVKQDNQKIGMIVDLVSEVKDIRLEDIENPPSIVTSISRRYIKGLIRLDGNIMILLNLANILTEQEKRNMV